jgi:hypothetical protein
MQHNSGGLTLMQKNKLSSLLLLFVLMAATFVSGVAQSNYGVVRGIVADSQGAAIEGATVNLVSETTKIVRTTKTNGSGEYVFNAVEPASYTVDVSAANFKKTTQTGSLRICRIRDATLSFSRSWITT